jgi:hypothetical protein
MSKTDDPYVGILGCMSQAAGERAGAYKGPRIGTVLSVNPLQVQVSGIVLDKDNLLVSDALLSGYSRGATLGEESGTLTMGSGLSIGDRVQLLCDEDGQTYSLIAVLKAVT